MYPLRCCLREFSRERHFAHATGLKESYKLRSSLAILHSGTHGANMVLRSQGQGIGRTPGSSIPGDSPLGSFDSAL